VTSHYTNCYFKIVIVRQHVRQPLSMLKKPK